MMGITVSAALTFTTFAVFLLTRIHTVSSSIRRVSTLYGTVEVIHYQQYSNVQLLRFDLPPLVILANWRFRAYRSLYECNQQEVVVYLQAGSYPLVRPNNDTFPPRFYLDRTSENIVTLLTDNDTLLFTEHFPVPGPWYGAAFLAGNKDDKIVQKEFGQDCKYFLEPELSLDVRDVVDSAHVNKLEMLNVTSSGRKDVRFFLAEDAWSYDVKVVGCMNSLTVSNTNFSCNVTLKVNSLTLPYHHRIKGETTCSANQINACSLRVTSPDVKSWQYLAFINWGSGTVTVRYEIKTSVCRLLGSPYVQVVNVGNSMECHLLPQLDRYQGYGDFRTQFGLLSPATGGMTYPIVFLFSRVTTIVPFRLEPELDIGGTLKLEITLLSGTQSRLVYGCLQRGSIHFDQDPMIPCEDDPLRQFVMNLSEPAFRFSHLYVPYPEPGAWFLSLSSQCHSQSTSHMNTSSVEDCDNHTVLVKVQISMSKCVDGGCENSGQCNLYYRGTSFYSTCKCLAGWRGYSCSDGQLAQSYESQLEDALLLTLSNLLFIPAIVVAIYRRFYAEALVYLYTMFFSTFYHACDGDRVLTYCITKYSILSTSDFFGSVLAFWVTLMAMVRVKEPFLPTLHMAGVLGLMYGVLYDRHSLWLFVGPAVSGLSLLMISWALRCYRRHKCYPTWRRYLFFLLPGVVCAVLGLCLFTFVETEQNYRYVHSVWHVTMAISIVFVLPPRPRWRKAKEDKEDREGIYVISHDSLNDDSRHNDSRRNDDHSTHDSFSHTNGGIVNLAMDGISQTSN